MIYVCPTQRMTYTGLVSSTSSDLNADIAIASLTNVSNTSGGARPNGLLTDAYCMYALKSGFYRHYLYIKDTRYNADDGFTLQPTQLISQRRP